MSISNLIAFHLADIRSYKGDDKICLSSLYDELELDTSYRSWKAKIVRSLVQGKDYDRFKFKGKGWTRYWISAHAARQILLQEQGPTGHKVRNLYLGDDNEPDA